MSAESDAEAVLSGFLPIGDDSPHVRGFEEAVRARIAERAVELGIDEPSPRPSPSPPAAGQLDRIETKLDEVLSILRGGS